MNCTQNVCQNEYKDLVTDNMNKILFPNKVHVNKVLQYLKIYKCYCNQNIFTKEEKYRGFRLLN